MQCLGYFLLSQTPHVPVSCTAGSLLGFTQNVLYPGNTEHIPIRAGCLHPAVSRYKSAPSSHAAHIALLPQSSAAQAAAFHELLKHHFLFVAKHQSSSFFKKKNPTEFFCELIFFFLSAGGNGQRG